MRHPEKYIDVYIVRLTSLQYYSVKLGVPTWGIEKAIYRLDIAAGTASAIGRTSLFRSLRREGITVGSIGEF